MNRSARIALLIEIAVIFTAIPRWTPALMIAEGFTLPDAWLTWWIPMSAIFNTGMAIAEAVAIAFVFIAWHHAKRREDRRVLLILTFSMMLTFSFVLTPFVASSVIQADMKDILTDISQYGIVLVWGTAVVLTTGVTVMAVGVAQGNTQEDDRIARCWCGFGTYDQDEMDTHAFDHEIEVAKYPSPNDALNGIMSKYANSRKEVIPDLPQLVELARWRQSQERIRKEVL